jgi:hypothetical protein
MINEKLLWHTGEQMLAEHVQRAVAVRSQNSIALSSPTITRADRISTLFSLVQPHLPADQPQQVNL